MIKTKKRSSQLKRWRTAIIIFCVLIALLVAALLYVLQLVKGEPYVDIDGTTYYIISKDSVYRLYYEDKETVLPMDTELGYYITDADTLLDLDSESGELKEVIAVDVEEDPNNPNWNEVLGINSRILIFPRVEKKNLRSVEVNNSYGNFTFLRFNKETGLQDDDGDFVIKGSPQVGFDQDLFASLYVTAGYTLSMLKIEDPIIDENGEFSEYGLVPETRVDDEGNEYEYVPAYYIVTSKAGVKHKVIIGDRLVTGGGYYAQYVKMDGDNEIKRESVYVMNPEVGTSMLVPIETYVTPTISFTASSNTYFDVEDFALMNKKPGSVADEKNDPEYEGVISFSYIDLAERANTINSTIPYVFNGEFLNDGYTPYTENIVSALTKLFSADFVGVSKFLPTEKDLAEHGLYTEYTDSEGNIKYKASADHLIRFNNDILDENNEVVQTLQQTLLISKNEETGNYYVYTIISNYDRKTGDTKPLYSYDMIAEVHGYCFDFLTWDSYDWVSAGIININIAYVDELGIKAPGYNAFFDVDNSLSPTTGEKLDATRLYVKANDSNGNDLTTYSFLTVEDTQGRVWYISSSKVTVFDAQGNQLTATGGKYTKNRLGDQVYIVSGVINGIDGNKYEIGADVIKITDVHGNVEELKRYDTRLFEDFYQTVIYASLENSYHMSDEEEAALLADESNWQLTLNLKDTEGKETEFSFYKLTSRKSYVTVNGEGGFYMLTNRVSKIISDAQKFFSMTPIAPTDKN